ncbi:hypothetical protein [Methanoregula sp.]|uniref:hypothetical protein n=1 Tax=Methanoregula sp. TaxID=2052170 RepID=UPI002C6AA4CF|nr:hypothetical protein [Methanoregula sp.]HVP96093.1 hypothetical protein [Methanoregula sp.]
MAGSSEIRDTITSILKETSKPVSIAGLAKKTGISRNTLSKYLEGMVQQGNVAMIHHGMAKKFYIPSQDLSSHTGDEQRECILILDASRSVLIFDKIYEKDSISSLNPERTEEVPFPQEIAAVLESGQFLQWFSGLKTASGPLHSLYEIKKTDDTNKAMMLAYRAFPIPLGGMEPFVVVYTKQSWKTAAFGSWSGPSPSSDESSPPSDDCVIILQNMHIVHASQSFLRLIGRPLDSIKGRNIKRFFQASSVQDLEKHISSIRKGSGSIAQPMDISLAGRETETAGNYSFHLGWIPYMDTGAVIGVLRTVKSKLAETASLPYAPSAWDNYLRDFLTRLQVNEREPCAVLVPWALENMNLLLNSDKCILDIHIQGVEEFRCSYCWHTSNATERTGTGVNPTDKSPYSPLPFGKPDPGQQDDHVPKNSDDLLRIPIRKNKKILGRFSWHPGSSDDAPVIDWEKFEMACTLLALKIWHQHCLEKSQVSQQGFNEVFGKVTI